MWALFSLGKLQNASVRYLGSELDDPFSSPPIIYKLWVDGAKEQATFSGSVPNAKPMSSTKTTRCRSGLAPPPDTPSTA
jgi:hypothetical protein